MSQRKTSGRSKGKSAATATSQNEPRPEQTAVETTVEKVRRVRRKNQETIERYQAATAPSTLGPLSAVTASPSDITDELEKGGPAFGAFVKSVGLGVADAQTALDKNLVATAQALSAEKIDVITIFEQHIDDDGHAEEGQTHIEHLPLVNFLPPVSYQWTRVFLQADMMVSEFNTANGFNVQGKSKSFSAGIRGSYGTGGFGISGGLSYGSSSYSASGESSFSADSAAGSLHMEATLEPRPDMQIPAPLILQKGPRLKVTASSRQDIDASGNVITTGTAAGKLITLTCTLTGNSGALLPGKDLDFTISEALLDYKSYNNPTTKAAATTTGTSTSGTEGTLYIDVIRKGAAYDPTKPPTAVIIRVWLGLVAQTITIQI